MATDDTPDYKLHDGYEYGITLTCGVVRRLCDPMPIEAIWKRLEEAVAKNQPFIFFQGARDASEMVDEAGKPELNANGEPKLDIGPLEGVGPVRIAEVACLQYWDEEEHAAASEAAQQSAAALLAHMTGAIAQQAANELDNEPEPPADPAELPQTSEGATAEASANALDA